MNKAPLVAAALAAGLLAATGQQLTQTLTLQNGWNAVYLEVSPTDGRPASLLVGLPVASVWTRVDKLASVDFVQDASEATFNEADWLKWCPPPQPEFLNDLREMQGGRAYLLKLTNGPVNWEISGPPVPTAVAWVPNAWNLRSFPVAPSGPPTFRTYFQTSPSHYDATQGRLRGVYRLGNNGVWTLTDPDAPMRAGEACWVYCQGASTFTAPFELKLEAGETLDFGESLDRINVEFSNLASGWRTITVSQIGSFIPGALAYRRFNEVNGFEWVDMPNPFIFSLTNGYPRSFSLAVRRSRLPELSFASVLQVADEKGVRYNLPARASRNSFGYAGLWVGSVTVSAVSEPHFGSLTTNRYALVNGQPIPLTDPGLVVVTNQVVFTNEDNVVATTNLLLVETTDGSQVPVYERVLRDPAVQSPSPTKSEFTMRLLLHVDAAGKVNLLKEVVQMWRDGTYTNDARGYRVPDKTGTYVLLTLDDLLGQFKGSTLRNGVAVGRRLSAIGFDFDGKGTNHLALAGAFLPGQALTGTIEIGSDYPLNPFRHKYHPDHDNLDAKFQPIADAAQKEAYAVTRQLRFEIAAVPASSATDPDPAFSSVHGIYRETLVGLHKQPILVQGKFDLSRASLIAELNPSPKP